MMIVVVVVMMMMINKSNAITLISYVENRLLTFYVVCARVTSLARSSSPSPAG